MDVGHNRVVWDERAASVRRSSPLTTARAVHASGVAALLLASKSNLTPAQVRASLVRGVNRIPGKRNEVGAGVIDALAVINPGRK